MAEYKSKHKELSFYVDGERKKFNEGSYKTEIKKEIDVLEKLIDAQRVDKPKETATTVVKKQPSKPNSNTNSKLTK